MRDNQHEPECGAPPRCALCGDVIGVYEPLVLETDGLGRVTSRAAEPGIVCSPGPHYHLACHPPRPVDPADWSS